MATVTAGELTNQVTSLYAGTDFFYGALLDSQGTTFSETTTLASILEFEIPANIGDYVRQEFNYTSGDINAYSGGVSVDAKRITFLYSGSTTTLWTATHLAVIKAPSLLSSTNVKSVLSTFDQSGSGVDIANNRITVSTYSNFHDGDKVTLEPAAATSLPAGIATATAYYVKKIATSQIELYTDESLTTIVDITGTSTGTGSIKNANGTLFGYYALPATIQVGPGQSLIYDIGINQGV